MVRRTGTFAVLVVLAALVAPVTAPVSISYVHSGSMTPTIAEGDGFLLVPADDVRPGDVVTFHSEHRGEYVTHRVVDVTDDGFVTRGDANPTADQAAGHPQVTRDDVVGEVATVGGHLVVVPGLGLVVEFVSEARELLVAAALLAGLMFGRRPGTRPARPVTTSRELFQALFALGVLAAVALILLGGTTVTVPAGESSTDVGPSGVVLADGETATVDFDASGSGLLTRVVTAEGARVTGVEGDREMTVALARSGPVDGEVRVSFHSYPPVLPDGTLVTLQRIHPALAALASVLVTFVPGYLLTHVAFVGGEPLRSPRWIERWGDGP